MQRHGLNHAQGKLRYYAFFLQLALISDAWCDFAKI